LRLTYPALQRGDYTRLYAAHGIYAFGRRLGEETLVVVLNNSSATIALKIPVADYLANDTVLQDVWNGDNDVAKVLQGHLCGPNLPPRSGGVFVNPR